MNAPAFTAAPWTLHFTNKYGLIVGAIDPADGEQFAVCTVHGENEEVGSSDAAKANGALIKASPDLYEALAECVAELEAYDAPSDPMDSHNVRLAKARAALAKAVTP